MCYSNIQDSKSINIRIKKKIIRINTIKQNYIPNNIPNNIPNSILGYSSTCVISANIMLQICSSILNSTVTVQIEEK